MLFMPAVIIVAAYFLLFDAQLREKKRLDAEVKGLRQELLKVTAMKNSMEKTRREYAALNADLHYRLRQMPEEKEVPNLLRQVSLAAQETKTHMKYFAPKESEGPGVLFGAALRNEIHGILSQHRLLFRWDPKT